MSETISSMVAGERYVVTLDGRTIGEPMVADRVGFLQAGDGMRPENLCAHLTLGAGRYSVTVRQADLTAGRVEIEGVAR